jgi:pyocin large subunit-like protein
MANLFSRPSLGSVMALALLGLCACDAGPSAVPKRDKSAERPVASEDRYGPADTASDDDEAARPAKARTERRKAAEEDVPLVDGVPMWSATRKAGARDSAQAQFERNGKDFGAETLEDYVAKAHAFAAHPPKGAKRLDRPNGDTLIYDARGNVFAVVAKSGAPKAMFKPDDGVAYWQRQVDRQDRQADGDSKG